MPIEYCCFKCKEMKQCDKLPRSEKWFICPDCDPEAVLKKANELAALVMRMFHNFDINASTNKIYESKAPTPSKAWEQASTLYYAITGVNPDRVLMDQQYNEEEDEY